MVGLIDRPDMTSDVYRGCKTTTQQQQQQITAMKLGSCIQLKERSSTPPSILSTDLLFTVYPLLCHVFTFSSVLEEL